MKDHLFVIARSPKGDEAISLSKRDCFGHYRALAMTCWMALRNGFKFGRRGFTLTEFMTAGVIAMFVIASAYGVYIMAWRWWTEISPAIEAQRIARIAVADIITGTVDPTEGTDTISSITYSRRNGIAAAMFDADNIPPSTPVISADNTRIDFRTEADNSNAYYIATDEPTGDKFVYYRNNAGTVRRIDSTRGITALEFGFFVDGAGVTRYSIIQVKAKADKDILGTRGQAYPVRVEYTDYVYLKNKL